MGKPRKVLFELISPEDVLLSGQPYELLAEVRAEEHFDVAEAKIALAWRKGTKPDVDGHLVLGKCVKATELQRELVDYDFVIVLNREVWEDPDFTYERKLALLDHELCHAARAVDADGDPVIDTKGRAVWRTRKHDIEEFEGIVRRHGCWKRDLEKFAAAILEKKKEPLFAGPGKVEELAGDASFLDAADRMAGPILAGVADSITLQVPGHKSVTIDRKGAENLRKKAQAAKAARGKKTKDPG